MKSKLKKSLSLLLALVMAMSCMSLGAFAAETTVSAQDALNGAVASAQEGDTITIDIAGTYTLPNLEKKITIKGSVDGVVFQHTSGGNVASIPNGATFENVTFNFGNVDYHGFQHAGEIVMKDCTINGRLTSYGDMTFESCTFNAPGTTASGINGADYAMWDYGEHTVTYSNCHFYGAGKFLNVYRESADKTTVYVNGCDFHSTTTKKAAVNVKATSGSPAIPLTNAVTITNCTTDDNFPTASKNGTTIIFNSLAMLDDIVAGVASDNTITIDGTQVYPEVAAPAVAQIGETKYETLAAAVAAAKSGDTVTLLKDAPLDDRIWVGSGVTIDGNQYKIFPGDTNKWTDPRLNTDASYCASSGLSLINLADGVTGVTIQNVTITDVENHWSRALIGTGNNSSITLTNVVLEHTSIHLRGGDALALNGDCTITGSFAVTLGDRGWSAISFNSNNAEKLDLTECTSFTFTDERTSANQPIIIDYNKGKWTVEGWDQLNFVEVVSGVLAKNGYDKVNSSYLSDWYPVSVSGASDEIVYYSSLDLATLKPGDTINADPTGNLPSDCVAINNGNGTWTVQAKSTAPWTGEGTSESPYLIANEADLTKLAENVNGGESYSGVYFKLTSDIALTSAWTPIGSGAKATINGNNGSPSGAYHYFAGTFDGLKDSTKQGKKDGNFTISNLLISDAAKTQAYHGLFGATNGATIKNLTVKGVSIEGPEFDGALVGYAYNTALSDCFVNSNVAISGSHFIGGAVGYAAKSTLTNVDMTAVKGSIRASDATGEDGDDVGGLVGYFGPSASMSKCDVAGSGIGNTSVLVVSGLRQVGGLAGLSSAAGTITDCSVRNTNIVCATNSAASTKKANKIAFGGLVGGFNSTCGAVSGSLSSVKLLDEEDAVVDNARVGLATGGRYDKNGTNTLPEITLKTTSNNCTMTVHNADELAAAMANKFITNVIVPQDIELTSTVVLDRKTESVAGSSSSGFSFGGNVGSTSLTIELQNDSTITATNARALWVKSGSLTLSGNGTVQSVHDETTDTNFASSSSVIRVGDSAANTESAKLTISNGVTVSSPYCYGITAFGVNDTDDNKTTADIVLVVNGTVSVNGVQAAVSGNGTSTLSATTMTIGANAEVTATQDYAIYHPGKGTLTVKGTVSGKGGIEAKGGTIVINDGATVTATATASEQYHETSNNGTSTKGYAIAAVANTNYANNNSVTINGTVVGKVIILAEEGAALTDATVTKASGNNAEAADGYAWSSAVDGIQTLTVAQAAIETNDNTTTASLEEAIAAAVTTAEATTEAAATTITVKDDITLGDTNASSKVEVAANSTVTVESKGSATGSNNKTYSAQEIAITKGSTTTTAYVVSDGTNTAAIPASNVEIGNATGLNSDTTSAETLVNVSEVLAKAAAESNVAVSDVTGYNLSIELKQATEVSSALANYAGASNYSRLTAAITASNIQVFEVYPEATVTTTTNGESTDKTATFDASEMVSGQAYTFTKNFGDAYAGQNVKLLNYKPDGSVKSLGTVQADENGNVTITMTEFCIVTGQIVDENFTAQTVTAYNALVNYVNNVYMNLQDQFYFTVQFYVNEEYDVSTETCEYVGDGWYIEYRYGNGTVETLYKSDFSTFNQAAMKEKLAKNLAGDSVYASYAQDKDGNDMDGFYEVRHSIYPTQMDTLIQITLHKANGEKVNLYTIGEKSGTQYRFATMNSDKNYQGTTNNYLTELASDSNWADTANTLMAFGAACAAQNWPE